MVRLVISFKSRRGGEAVTQLFAEQIYRGSIPLRASMKWEVLLGYASKLGTSFCLLVAPFCNHFIRLK